MPASLPWTVDEDANRLLADEPLALIIGMLLDQQFPMERAFLSPHLLKQRLGGTLDPVAISEMDEEALEEVFRGPPALHRYPASMAKRTRDLCTAIVAGYSGDTAQIWTGAAGGAELLKRLKALPGFGDAKAKVFVGIIGKRLGAGPDGWEEKAADWPSIADIDSFDDVAVLREQKRAMKAKRKAEGA